MARRKKIEKIERDDMPFQVKCDICKERILPNAPLEGLVMQIGPDIKGICADCGTQVAQWMQHLTHRWG